MKIFVWASERGDGNIRSHFAVSLLSDYEKPVYCYLCLIFLKNQPFSYVENSEVRQCSKFSTSIYSKTNTKILIKVVELVKNRIAEEPKGTVGAVFYDYWTVKITHYVSALASYCTEVGTGMNHIVRLSSVMRLTLFETPPMNQVVQKENFALDDNESTAFNAESHVHFFTDVFLSYSRTFRSCATTSSETIQNNLSVDRMTGRLM